MIAVDMMIHTIRRNMTAASLLAGDADFTPLLNALSNEGMFVTLIHPPKASKELLAAADARRPLSARQVYDWLDPPSQARFGPFPTPSYGNASHDGNCQHIWSNDRLGIEIWCELIHDTIWASWPEPERSDRLSLRGGNWANTLRVASDDYGIQFPTELPEEFRHLQGS